PTPSLSFCLLLPRPPTSPPPPYTTLFRSRRHPKWTECAPGGALTVPTLTKQPIVDQLHVRTPGIAVSGLVHRRQRPRDRRRRPPDRKSTRLNSSHVSISYAVFCLNTKKHE